MKRFLLAIAQTFFLIGSAIVAALLGLWLAVILGTDSRMKQSFNDTARLAHTVSAVAFEFIRGTMVSSVDFSDYSIRSADISQATLVVMKDSGVSGIFSNGDIRRFSKPKDLSRLADEFNRFLKNISLEKNKLIRSGSSFYLILMDKKGNRLSYEYIGEELFLNDGTISRLLRPKTGDDEPLQFSDIFTLNLL